MAYGGIKLNFSYQEFDWYIGGLGDRIWLDNKKRGVLKFWLCCKRGKKIYKQLFENEFIAKDKEYDKYLFYKLRELLTMLDRQIETGYLTELLGDYYNWDVKQRKLTKNTWVSDEMLN